MKTVGLIGGMSWNSTSDYYQTINLIVARSLGGLNSAKIVLHSMNFHEVAALTSTGQWNAATSMLVDVATRLRVAGADFGAICVNTMHKGIELVEKESGLPFVHIADATAEAVCHSNTRIVGLLGNKVVTEDGFYQERLEKKYGISVVLPYSEDREFLHRAVYSELAQGISSPATHERCRRIVQDMTSRGARGIVLGCTELPSILTAADSDVPLFDTARIHATAIAERALGPLNLANGPTTVDRTTAGVEKRIA